MRRYIEYDVKSNDNPETQHVVRPIGDEIVFLNATAYNYYTDFCNLEKVKSEIVE